MLMHGRSTSRSTLRSRARLNIRRSIVRIRATGCLRATTLRRRKVTRACRNCSRSAHRRRHPPRLRLSRRFRRCSRSTPSNTRRQTTPRRSSRQFTTTCLRRWRQPPPLPMTIWSSPPCHPALRRPVAATKLHTMRCRFLTTMPATTARRFISAPARWVRPRVSRAGHPARSQFWHRHRRNPA